MSAKASAKEDPRLVRVTKICLALPEVTRRCSGPHAAFLVRKKNFAYFLNDHHGDGIAGIACKVIAGDNAALIRANPERFYMPAYIGSKGWVGLRLDARAVDWDEAAELIIGSYQLLAPKELAALVRSG
jgi:hypothetical protein